MELTTHGSLQEAPLRLPELRDTRPSCSTALGATSSGQITDKKAQKRGRVDPEKDACLRHELKEGSRVSPCGTSDEDMPLSHSNVPSFLCTSTRGHKDGAGTDFEVAKQF